MKKDKIKEKIKKKSWLETTKIASDDMFGIDEFLDLLLDDIIQETSKQIFEDIEK